MDLDFSPTPLLEALIDHHQYATARSIRDLLGERKHLPCRQVKEVLKVGKLDTMMSEHAIRSSSASILSFLFQLKTLLCRSEGPETLSQASLKILSKLSAVDRFLQLMFEYWLKNQEPKGGGASEQRRWSTESELINRTLSQVIQGLAGMVTSILETCSSRDKNEIPDDVSAARIFTEDVTDSVHVFQIAFFVCGFLIRLNHYTRFRPSLLSPLWKSICTIVEALQFLPEDLASEAIAALMEYIKEGLIETILRPSEMLLQRLPDENLQPQASAADIDISKHESSHKILIFLMGRLTTFLSLDTTSTCSSDALATLIAAMGIDYVMARQRTTQTKTATATPQAIFNKLLRNLSNKIEKSLCTSLRHRKRHATAVHSTVSLPTCKVEVLLQTEAPKWATAVSHKQLISKAFALGKTFLMVKLLNDSIRHETTRTPPSESDVDCMLRLAQELIFIMIPLCHAMLLSENSYYTTEPDLTSTVTRAVTETLLYCENMAPCLAHDADPGRARFHHCLVSWLQPPLSSLTASNNSHIHPMAKETSLNILHLHLLALSETNTIACVNLLGLLVKLLFSRRICSAFRSNLACLLTRILYLPHSCHLRKVAVELIVPEAIRLEAMMRPLRRGQKRKHSQDVHFGIEDLRLLCRIIAELSCRVSLAEGSPSFPENFSSHKSLTYVSVRISLATTDLRSGVDNTKTCFSLVESLFEDSFHRRPSQNSALVIEVLLIYIRCCLPRVVDISRLSGCLARICNKNHMTGESSYLTVMTEIIYTMRDMAKLVGPSTTNDTLEALAGVFHRLLSSDIDTIRSEALSALVAFTLALSEAHKTIILPISVPKEMRQYLKRRMENSTCGSNTNKDLHLLQAECAIRLQDRCARPHFGCSAFPSINSFKIPIGSYVVTMPVEDGQQGRNARVIFPPTKESLEDIRFIHGGDDVRIQSIQRVAILVDGTLKVYLKE